MHFGALMLVIAASQGLIRDQSCLKQICHAANMLQCEKLFDSSFSRKSKQCVALINLYGPTEATIDA